MSENNDGADQVFVASPGAPAAERAKVQAGLRA
jgi:hypothetical protein